VWLPIVLLRHVLDAGRASANPSNSGGFLVNLIVAPFDFHFLFFKSWVLRMERKLLLWRLIVLLVCL